MGKRVILASSSPRRKELLKTITENFEIIVSGCDETVDASLSPSETVMELAKRNCSLFVKNICFNITALVGIDDAHT